MAITSIKKGLIGANDINWDFDGTSSQFTKETSSGGTRSDTLVNSSFIPVTSTLRDKKFADKVTALLKGDLDVDAVLHQIMDNLENIGLPDTTNYFAIDGSGVLTIAAGKVTATELATNAVTTVKITDLAVTTGKIAADAITGAKVADAQIDSEHYVVGSIDNEHLAVDTVGRLELNMDSAGHYPAGFIIAHGRATVSGTPATLTITPTLESGITLAATDTYVASFSVNGTITTHIASVEFVNTTTFLVTASSGAFTNADEISYQVTRDTVDA